MASGSINLWQIKREKMEAVTDFIFLGSRITVDGECSHEIKRYLLFGRKAMTNLDSVLKSRDIALLTKVSRVKAMIFPVVMHQCEIWTIKKSEHWSPGPGLPGWQTDLWWQLSSIWTVPQARLGQSFPNKGSAEEMDRKGQEGRAWTQEASSSAARGWDRFLSGRETKQGKTKGHVHCFPFVQLKGLIYKSCKPSWLGKFGHMERFPTVALAGENICKFGPIVGD